MKILTFLCVNLNNAKLIQFFAYFCQLLFQLHKVKATANIWITHMVALYKINQNNNFKRSLPVVDRSKP